MSWQQLIIEAGDLDPEALADYFSEQGALAVTCTDAADQPLYEPEPGTEPLWSATRVSALFDASADLNSVKARLAAVFGAAVSQRLTQERLEDRDWERVWLERFKPMRFGDRLWVCPAGMRPEQQEKPVVIDLDPGLAFGTGTHPTTALCLEWLDRHPPRERLVLDYGCGSGILAIAALKLGAREAWAVDIDEQALWATRENAARNQVAERLLTALPDALPAKQFDLLVANILANPLIELAGELAGRLKPGGDLVLSGILADQVQTVSAAYQPWFALAEPVEQDGWVRLHGTRH